MPVRVAVSRAMAFIAFLLALVAALPALAGTTGDLRGTVTDDSGIEVPGVELTLTSPSQIGGKQVRTTDGTGSFHFVELMPGNYELTARKDGFQTVTVTDIAVKVGSTTVQNLTTQAGSSETVMEVEGRRPAVDVEDTSHGEVLTKEFLQKVPTGRSYQGAVQLAAGVLPGVGGNPNMAGAAYDENTYMLDGANITDPVTGTFSLNFNFDAIQQIEVLLGGYEPEYGVSLGGVINVVTETGTNNLEFDTSIFYENGNWAPRMDARYTADGFQLAPTGFDSSFRVFQIYSKISGPVVRDRAWFILSYAAERSVIANVGIDVPRDYDAHYVLGKLTVQPTSEHRFTAFLQLDPTTIDNQIQGDPYVKPEAQQRQVQGGFVTQGRWQWFMSPKANLDTQVVVQKSYIEVGGVPCTHDRTTGYHPCRPGEAEGYEDWETPGRVGSFGASDSVNFGYYYFDDRFRYQAATKFSVLGIKDPLGGSHDFKFGAEVNQTVWDQIQGYSGNTLFVDLNAVAYDPESFQNYYWLEITGPIKFRTSGSQWSLFAQDSYKPVSNLTVKYGIRFDSSIMRNDVGEPVVQGNMWGPRLYASWDPFGDQKTKIAGGYGRFNDTGRLEVSRFTSHSGYGSKLYLGEYFSGANGEGFLNSQSQTYSVDPVENPAIAHDKLRLPRVDEIILLLHREVIEDVAVRVNLTGKFTRNLYEYDETSLVYDQDGSSIIGSRESDPFNPISRLRTPTLAQRDYYQADFVFDKLQSRRWAARVTYSYSASFGSSTGALSGSFSNDPQTQFNYGPLNTDVRHAVKAFGYWDLPTDPWVQTIGVTLSYYSGQPLERLYTDEEFGGGLRIRPRGVYYRFPSLWEASVMFSQDIDVRKGKLVVSVEALNLFNNQGPDQVSSAFYTENRLFIYSRQSPLSVRLGLRYKF